MNHIANKNGGNRAFGLPGYKASSDYVLERVQKRFGKEFDTYLQYFNHTFEQTRKISVTGPSGEDVLVRTLLYNTATPLPGGITATLIDTPVDDARGTCHKANSAAKLTSSQDLDALRTNGRVLMLPENSHLSNAEAVQLPIN